MFLWTIFIFLLQKQNGKKSHEKTPHKDRLVLVALVAVLAFTVVNTVLLATQVGLDEVTLAMA
jgi:hypothetical protein